MLSSVLVVYRSVRRLPVVNLVHLFDDPLIHSERVPDVLATWAIPHTPRVAS
jgi:hypothetical protein